MQLQDPASAAAALHKAMTSKPIAIPSIPNVLSSNKGNRNVQIAQGQMPFPPNLLISHLASGTYVLSPVSPNGQQTLMAASHITPVSQPTIVTVQQNPITTTQQRGKKAFIIGYR